MAARIERTEAAVQDLIEIGEEIALHNPDAAERVLAVIEERCEALAGNPRMGLACPQLGDGLRQFPAFPYRYVIFFRPLDEGMRLIRVLHGSRDIPAVFRREPADQ
jgi:toxin ParE1/3/4